MNGFKNKFFSSTPYSLIIAICLILCIKATLAQSLPPPVPNLQLITVNDALDTSLNGGAIKASWKTIPGATHYDISLYFSKPSAGPFHFLEKQEVTDSKHIFTALKLQNFYTVRVVAKANGLVISDTAEESIKIPLFRLTPSAYSLTVSWYNRGGGLLASWMEEGAGQFVFGLSNEAGETITELVADSTQDNFSYIFPEVLQPNTNYIVNISSIGFERGTILEDGISRQTDGFGHFPFKTMVQGPPPIPNDEQISVRTDKDSNHFTVSWHHARAGVTQYSLIYTGDRQVSLFRFVDALTPGETTFNIEPNTVNELLVKAVNVKGQESSEYSISIQTTPLSSTKITVDAPEAKSGININTAQVSWPMIEEAEAYSLNLYRGGHTNTKPIKSASTTEITYTFKGLEPRTKYTVEVIAMAGNYYPSEKTTKVFTTGFGRMPTPSLKDIRLTVTINSLTMHWTNPLPGILTDYAINSSELFIIKTLTGIPDQGQTTFEELRPGTEYSINIFARGPDYSTSDFYTRKISTDYLGKLPTPVMTTAVAEDGRSDIRVVWEPLEDAQFYSLKLYLGANKLNESAYRVIPKIASLSETISLDRTDGHYTVGLVAMADGYRPSDEARMVVRPPTLQQSSFNLNTAVDSLSLSWHSDQALDSDFYRKTKFANLSISIEDIAGNTVIKPSELSLSMNTYSTDGLDEGTDYVLKIVLRVTLDNTSIDGEPLRIPFKTFKGILQAPTAEQISWRADQDTITVRWSGFPTGVTSYVLTLEEKTRSLETVVGARLASSTTFKGLNEGTTYTLSVVSSGDSRLYLPSDKFQVEISTDSFGQLKRPDVSLSVESSKSISASWNRIGLALSYQVSLYLNEGTHERIGDPIVLSGAAHVFENLSSASYRVGVVAQSPHILNSFEGLNTIRTGLVLPPPTSRDLILLVTANAVAVKWSDLNVAQGVQTYLISILTDTTEIGQQAIEVSANKYVFVGLRADTTYVLSVISNNAEAGFLRSERYTQAFRTRQMPQLDTPVLNQPELGDGSLTLSWPAVVNAMAYTVHLYRGTDTSVPTSQSKVPTRNTSYTFSDLHPATEYTAEVQAQAEHYINSEPATQTATTPKKKLSQPVRQDIEITATANSLTVSVRNISSPVEEYVVDIALQDLTQNTQQNFTRPIQKLKASSRSEIAFAGLAPATKYALRIVSSADSTRYINSPAYTMVVRTDYLADLSSATLTAFTQNRRGNIRLDWSRVAAAQAYIVNLYAGANNMDRLAIPMVAARVPAPQRTHILSGIDRNAHHTVGVVAIADGYRTAFETRVSALPRVPQESLFKLERDHDSLSLSWRSDQMLDADFNSQPHLASLFISIKDSTGSVVNEETKVSADRNAYFAGGLSARTTYVLNIVLRVAIDGTVLNSEALTISLQTLEQLPKPTRQQIRWVEGQNTLTVHWLNAPSRVTSYVLTLEGETTKLETVVDARSTGSTTFKGLNEETIYTLSVVSDGDSRLYSPSDIFRVEIITDKRHQLSRPHVMLGIENSVNISASWFPVDSATSYIVTLYRGDGRQERIGEPTTTSDTAYVFRELSLATNYTVAVTAQGRGLLNSVEGVGTIMTGQIVLPHPRGNDITLSATEDTIKVAWRGVVAEEVETYLISIYPDTADIGQREIDVSLNEYSFKNLLSDTYYEVSIVSSRDETGYVESAVYMEKTKTEFLSQLQKPTIDFLVVSNFSIVASWRAVLHEAAYTVNLYLSSDTSKPLRNTSITGTTHTFRDLDLTTSYTIEVIAQATHYKKSEPATMSGTTLRKQLPPPTNQDIKLSVAKRDITISSRDISPQVEDYVISISPLAPQQSYLGDIVFRTQTLNADLGNEIKLRDLNPRAYYEFTVIARGDSSRYIDSAAYTTMIKTGYKGTLSTPRVTAVTQERRNAIRVSWPAVLDTQLYQARLYRGANIDEAVDFIDEETTGPHQRLSIFENIDVNKHYTVGVKALSKTSLASEEARVSVRPPTLQASSFDYDRSTDTLSLSWNSDEMLDADFYDKTALATILISIEDSARNVVEMPKEISTMENTYRAEGLSAGESYVLNIVLRVAIDNVSLDGGTLRIPFKTIAVLPDPNDQRITWTAGQNAITVHWSSVPAGVTSYELTLAGETTRLVTVVTANPAGSITLNGLETQTTYTLSVVSSGDHSLYLPSNVFSTEITTTRLAQLELPDLVLTIKNGVDLVARWRSIDSANSYVVSLYLGEGEGERIGEPALVTGTKHTLKGLSAVTEYTLGVTAQGEGFADSVQAVAMTMTGRMVLPTPTGKEINLSATTNRVTVNWSHSDASQGLQTYFISIMPDTARVGQQMIEASAKEHVFINLLPGTDYLVSVVSSKDETSLVESEAYREPIRTRQRLKLQTPVLDLLEVIDDRITLSWDQIASATAYEVKLYRGRDMTRPLQQAVVAETTHTFDMLDARTEYTIRVQAQADAYRPSDFARISTGTPKRKLSTPDEQNIDLTIASNRVTISWRSTPSGVSFYRISILVEGEIQMEVIPAQAGQLTFAGLKPLTLYVINMRASGDLERYIDSGQYAFPFRTSNSERLPAPTQFTAVTGNRRSEVRAELTSVPNAQRYFLRLYEGANSKVGVSSFTARKNLLASQTMDVIRGLDPSKHYTLGVVAQGTGYRNSMETRENVLPPALEERFLRTQVDATGMAVNWNSAHGEFQRKYLHAEFVFSVEDSAGVEVVAEQTVDISDDRYQTPALLSGVDYRLRAKVRVTIGGVPLDSEALIVPFRTLEALLQPTKQQITWTASLNTITVFWEKTPSEVMEYSLSIAGIRIEESRNAQGNGSFQFTDLNAGTDYTLVVRAKGDSRLYLLSPALLAQITTDRINQFKRPRVTLSIENNTDIVASWPPVSAAMEYQVSLYLGDGEKERTGDPVITTANTAYTFRSRRPATEYTLGVLARGRGLADSVESLRTIKTEPFVLPRPTSNDITLSATTGSITVKWPTADSMQATQIYELDIEPDASGEGTRTVDVSNDEYVFERLLTNTSYTVSIASSRAETAYVKSEVYSQTTRTKQILQLDPVVLGVLSVSSSSITLNWSMLANATSYTVNLHLGNDTRMHRQQAVVIETNHTFKNLNFDTLYTLEVIATAKNRRNSKPITMTAETLKRQPPLRRKQLPRPSHEDLELRATTKSITVISRNALRNVEEYVIDISAFSTALNFNRPTQRLNASFGSEITFTKLTPRRQYTLTVTSSADSTRYIGSGSYTTVIRTDDSILSTPLQFTAVTGNRRNEVSVGLTSVPNAERYILRLYEGANSKVGLSAYIKIKAFSALQTMDMIRDLDPSKHHTIGVVAQGVGYNSSTETRVNILPPTLQASSFSYDRSAGSISLNWSNDKLLDPDFYSKTAFASMLISVINLAGDSAGEVAIEPKELSTIAQTYRIEDSLAGENYAFNIVLRVTIDGVSLDGKALRIPFETLEKQLPRPSHEDLELRATTNSITVISRNASENIEEYVIDISASNPALNFTRLTQRLNASFGSEITFTKLTPRTQYTLTVTSSADSTRYIGSGSYTTVIRTAVLSNLPAPMFLSAVTGNRRNEVSVDLTRVPNAQRYILRLYASANSMVQLSYFTQRKILLASQTMDTIRNLDPSKHHTIGVVAQGVGYNSSTETRVNILPPTLQASSFNYDRSPGLISLNWSSDKLLDPDFYNKTAFASMFISVISLAGGSAGEVAIEPQELSPTAQTYRVEDLLAGENYAFNIVLRVTIDGVSLDGKALRIPFKTLKKQLPRPSHEDLELRATTNSITVISRNALRNIGGEVREYVIDISAFNPILNFDRPTQRLNANFGSEITFTKLTPRTQYTLTVTSSADSTRYIGSGSYTTMIRTDDLSNLPAPIFLSAVTGNRRSEVRVGLTRVPNAQRYFLRLYEGVNSTVYASSYEQRKNLLASQTMDRIRNLDPSKHHTIGVVAQGVGYNNSTETRVNILPPTLQASSFSYDRSAGLISLNWSSDKLLDPDFYNKTAFASMFISVINLVGDSAGEVAIEPKELSTIAQTYRVEDSLAGENYAFNIVLRVTIDGVSLDGKALRIPFETLEKQLPRPSHEDLELRATTKSITVISRNALRNVEEYVIDISASNPALNFTRPTQRLNASFGSEITFTKLTPRRQYTLTVTSSADSTRYIGSGSYTTVIRTDDSILSTPLQFTAVTGNRRNEVSVGLTSVPNAERYILRLYEGANSKVGLSAYIKIRAFSALQTMDMIRDLDPSKHHTIGVVAQGVGYNSSTETRVNILPPTLQASSFNYDRSAGSISLNWSNDELLDPDFYNKTAFASMLISVISLAGGSAGEVAIEPKGLSTIAQTYRVEDSLAGENYAFSIVLRVTIDGVSLDGKALRIPFETLEKQLPRPSHEDLELRATTNSITVISRNASENIEEYVIDISASNPALNFTRLTQRLNASFGSEITFTKLTPRTQYTLTVTSSADSTRYIGSGSYTTVIRTAVLSNLPAPMFLSAVTGNRRNEVSVDLTRVPNAQRYILRLYASANSMVQLSYFTQRKILLASQTMDTIRNLDPSKHHTIGVVAQGVGYNSSTETRVNILPPTLQASSFSYDRSAGSISLNWSNDKLLDPDFYNKTALASMFISVISLAGDSAGEVAIEPKELSTTAQTYRVEDLPAGENYAFNIVLRVTIDGVSLDGKALRIPFETLERLRPPTTVVAVTHNEGKWRINISWSMVENAQKYRILLYAGAHSSEEMSIRGTTLKDTRLAWLQLDEREHYTVGVIAQADGYDESKEVRVNVLPHALEARFLRIKTNTTGVTVHWDSEDDELQNRHAYSDFVFSVEDSEGKEVIPAQTINTADSIHKIPSLPLGHYMLSARARVTTGGVSLDSAALGVPFSVLTLLPTPTSAQISLTATANVVIVKWSTVPAGVSTYNISLSLASSPIDMRSVSATPINTRKFSGLVPNTVYTVMVIAQGNATEYVNSDEYTTMIRTDYLGNLSAPLSLEVTTVTDNSLSLSWNEVANATTYTVNLYFASDTSTPLQSERVTGTTSMFNNLSFASSYALEVIAEAKNYRASQPARLSTMTLRRALPVPSSANIELTATANSITVTSRNAPNEAGTEVEEYVINIEPSSELTQALTTSPGSAITFVELSPRTTYTLTVISSADNTRYINSNEYTTMIRTDYLGNLSTPLSLMVTTVTDKSLSLSWDEVANATTYTVSLYLASDRSTALRSETVVGTTHTLNSLSFASSYTLEVVAQAKNYRVSQPATLSKMTLRRALPVPSSANIELTATANSITVTSRNAPNEAGTEVEEYVINIEPSSELTQALSTSPGSAITFAELSPRTTYTLTIISSGDNTRYINSNEYTTMIRTDYLGNLSTPLSLMVTTVTDKSLSLSWNEVANATTYTVSLYLASDRSTPLQSERVTGTTSMFNNLSFASSYALEVVAQAKNYRASQPATALAMTLRRALPVPSSANIELTATANSITVTSRNAPNEAGTEVEEYVINIEPSSELTQALSTSPGSAITFANLDPRTTYTLTVISSADNTRYINSNEYTTMIRTDYLGNLSTPLSLEVTTVTDKSLLLSWDEVANATTYTVSLYLASDTSTPLQSERVTGTTSMFNNLNFASSYTLEVIAQAKNYRDSQPATLSKMTARRALSAPSSANIELTATANSITVTSRNAPNEAGTEVEEYVINIEQNPELTQALSTSPGSAITFAELSPRTTYTLTVISSADNTRYINSNEYTTMIRTDYLGNLSMPLSLEVTTVTDKSLSLSWDGVANATTYTVNLYLASDTSTALRSETVVGTTHTLNNLSFASSYALEVIAQAKNYRASQPATLSTMTLRRALPVPSSVNIELTATANSITVTSRNALDTVGTEVEEYVINIEPSSELTQALSTNPGSAITFAELSPRTTYTLTVISSADNTRYINSNEYTTMIRTDYLGNLSTPLSLRVTTVTDKSLSLSWDEVANATTYTVSLYLASDRSTALRSETVVGTTHTLNNLSFASSYALEVVAQAKNYRASQPATLSTMTLRRALPVPSSVNIELTATANSITVTSRNAPNEAGTEVEEYVINIEPSSELTQALSTSPGSAITFAELSPRTTYTLTVISSADNTRYINSNEYITMIRTDYLGNLSMPLSLRVTTVTDKSLSLSWDEVANATTYTVSLYLASDRSTALRSETVVGTTHTLNSLSFASSYALEVIAEAKNYRDSQPAKALTMTARRALPVPSSVNIELTATANSITVTSRNALDTVGTEVEEYVINIEQNPELTQALSTNPGSAITFAELSPRTTYTLTVISSADNTRYINSNEYTTMIRTDYLGNLSMPLSLEVTTVTDKSLSLSWDEVANATTYTVNLYPASDRSTALRSETVVRTTHTLNNLSFASSYTLEVIAQAKNYRDSQPAKALTMTARRALPVPSSANIELTATANSITVTSRNAPNEAGTEVEEYVINIEPSSELTQALSTSPGSAITFAELSPRTTYTLTVISSADNTRYINSNEYTTMIRTDYLGNLSMPLSLRVTTVTDKSLSLSWNEVANATTYTVSLYPASDRSTPLRSERVTGTTSMFNNLSFASSYTLEVIAQAKNYRASQPATALTMTLRRELPVPSSANIELTATANSITVTSRNAPNEAGTEVEEYVINIEPSSELTQALSTSPGSAITFAELSPRTTYTLTVISSADNTRYINSNEYTMMIRTDYLGNLSTPLSLMVTTVTDKSLSLSWDEVANATTYTVNLYPASDRSTPLQSERVTGTTSMFNNLSFASSYALEVIAEAKNYRDSQPATLSKMTLRRELPVPSSANIELTATANSITVTSRNAPNEAGTEVEEYVINIEPSSELTQALSTSPGSAITFVELSPRTTYTLTVLSSADNTRYINSNEYTTMIRTDYLGNLSMPLSLEVTTVTDKSLSLSWDEVANATTYTVNLYPASDTSTPLQSERVTGTTSMFNNLNFASSYTLEVVAQAKNYRASQPATLSTMTTRRALPVPSSANIELTATANSITVTSRNAPNEAGTEVEEYVINIEPSSELTQALSTNPGSAITFVELSPRTTYTLTVISSADNTRYINSNEYTTMIRTDYLGNLSAPLSLEVTTVTDKSLSLSWDEVANATTYTVSLYLASDRSTALRSETVVGTTHTLNNLSFASSYALEVVAQAKNYRASQPATLSTMTARRALPVPSSVNIELTATANSITVTSRNAPNEAGTEVEEYVINIEQNPELTQALSTNPGSAITFVELSPRTTYTLTVISSADNTRYINSNEYTTMIRTDYLGNLSTPLSLRVTTVTDKSLSLSWDEVANATTYTVSLYLASDRSTPLQSERVTGTTSMFNNLSFASSYTLEVIAQAKNYRASQPATLSKMTLRRALSAPSSVNIELTATANSITVDWTAVALQAGSSTYELSITSTDDSTIIGTVDIDAMTRTYTFTDLMPNTEYAVTVIVKGNERYISSESSIVKGTTGKLPGLRLRLRVFLEGPLQ